jgi:hypothetical protein
VESIILVQLALFAYPAPHAILRPLTLLQCVTQLYLKVFAIQLVATQLQVLEPATNAPISCYVLMAGHAKSPKVQFTEIA